MADQWPPEQIMVCNTCNMTWSIDQWSWVQLPYNEEPCTGGCKVAALMVTQGSAFYRDDPEP